MADTVSITTVNRRTFLLTATAAATLFPGFMARADTATQLTRSELFETDLKAILKGATPVEGKIAIDLPEIAENGNFVPITIHVDSLMTADDYVKTVHILSTSNPVAKVATFHLSPINAVARVQSRMRLAKTQDVVVVAEMSTGAIALSQALVKVTIGGCGG